MAVRNSPSQMNDSEPKSWYSNSKISVALLCLTIFLASLASDRLIPNSLLSLPLFISTVISLILTDLGIPKLKQLKVSQFIRKEGPKAHYLKKGTPTMGGLLILPAGLLIGSLISVNGTSSQQLLAISGITICYMLIGSLDDWKSLIFKSNKGLSAKEKLLLQALAGLIFLSWCKWQGWINSSIDLPLGLSLDMGIFIWPLALFVLLAESNATNLTDGLDGLASGCGAIVFTGIAIEQMLRGNDGNPSIAGFSMAMAGTWLGFLIHNRNPAKIFMGDTGSLAMGASLSGVALLSNSLFPLLIMGGVFLAESISVIIQVLVFKATKKINKEGYRVFRMAPLHHHFEIRIGNEQIVVESFWMVSICLVGLSLLLEVTLPEPMSFFTWKETGLTSDCQSLEAMASRFEEAANLMRRMSEEGFKLKKKNSKQLITHPNPHIFKDWGFTNEEPPYRQLQLFLIEIER